MPRGLLHPYIAVGWRKRLVTTSMEPVAFVSFCAGDPKVNVGCAYLRLRSFSAIMIDILTAELAMRKLNYPSKARQLRLKPSSNGRH
jgi:hypothetical protein